MHVVFFNVARCLHLTDAIGFNVGRRVAVTHWMRPSLILPSQLFADRYAGTMPTAKAVKRERYHQIRGGARSPNGEISPEERVQIKN
jgi:hypothetical protein